MVKKLSQVNYHIFSLFFISLTGLMFAKVTCNTCNKSVCCRNLIEMFVMPYNGSEIIKNMMPRLLKILAQIGFGYTYSVLTIYFLLL